MFKRKKGLLVLTLFLTLTLALTAGAQAEVKNMIVLIGDGLGQGQIDLTRYMTEGKDAELELMKLPNVGIMMTSSTQGVPDSAAAGTAMATGHKTDNGMVGMSPTGAELDSILDYAETLNKSTGIISTNKVTDATPAAFAVSAESRDDEGAIAKAILNNDVEVVLGGGADEFTAETAGEDVVKMAKEMGYEHVTNETELANAEAPNNKLLGLFNPSYMNYKLDRDNVNSNEPSLKEMTKKAVQVLSRDEDGFFLMSEGARIDHAAHAADIHGVVAETLEFDETVEYAVEWAKKNGNTMVVVVADHETLGFSVTEPMNKEALMNIEVSPEYMAAQMKEKKNEPGMTIESIKNVFAEYANIEMTDQEAREFNDSIINNEGNMYYTYMIGWEIGSVIAKEYNAGVLTSDVRAKSSTGGHTLNSVPIFAYGPESGAFNDVLDNTEFYEEMFQAFKPGN
ncbi:MAG TPA: alkaline phosphatase [Halanaerobiales bacterium]|nr:alkaline phosphatase [Halanaerobiales bacterium]